MPESKKAKLVLLDFDGTLVEGDIFRDFIIFRLLEYQFLIRLLLAIPYFLGHKLKLMTNDKAKEKIFTALFKGESSRHFRSRVEDFWYHHGTEINPAIVDVFSNYQKEKADFLIVSANFAPIISAFAGRNYGFDFLATELEEVDGKLSGRFASPNCYGDEKVRRLNIRVFDRSLYSEIHAYGDSRGDLPMLRWADKGYLLRRGAWRKIQ